MAQTNGDVLAKDFENIILAWSSGISGEQREVLAPEARELVQMLCSSAERVRKQHELDVQINELSLVYETNDHIKFIEKRIAELKAQQEAL